MKYFKTLIVLLFSSVILLFSCNNSKSKKQEQAVPMEIINLPTPPNSTTQSRAPESAQNAAGVWHYTCSKGCVGGAGTAVNCTNCGNILAHNQAYHSNINTAPAMTPFTPTTAESSQNAAGVWHYTCTKGCAGGSGSTGNCSNCGGALAHNQAYHQ